MRMSKTKAVGRVLLASAALWTLGALAVPESAQAWRAATGPRGGAAVAGPRGAAAVGPYGGAAVAGPRGAAAVGPQGNVALAGRPAYRPPAVVAPVPVYPGYARPVAGAVAVGAVAGATAGAVARATASPVVAAPSLGVGATMEVLPAGCAAAQAGGVTYYRCGDAWVRPYMQGSNVAYVVVPAP